MVFFRWRSFHHFDKRTRIIARSRRQFTSERKITGKDVDIIESHYSAMCSSAVLYLVDSTTSERESSHLTSTEELIHQRFHVIKKKTDGSFFLQIWKLYIIKTGFMIRIRTRTFDDEIGDNNSFTKWSDHPITDKITLPHMGNFLSISLTSHWYFHRLLSHIKIWQLLPHFRNVIISNKL